MIESVSILGCGWLGEPLAFQLKQKGIQVKGSSRNQDKIKRLSDAGIEMHSIDLTAVDEIPLAFIDSDAIIINTPVKVYEHYRNFLDLIKKSGSKRILFVSSTSVYKSTGSEVNENSSCEPTPLFNIEELFRKELSNNCCILRPGGLIGPGRHPGRFFSRLGKISNPGHPVNMVQQIDCINIISALVLQPELSGTWNLVGSEHPSKGEYYPLVSKRGGYPIPDSSEPSDNSFKIVSNRKVSEQFSYQFKSIWEVDGY